jgi:MFS family permease
MKSSTNEIRRDAPLIVSSGVGVALSSIVLPFYSIGALVKPLTEAFGWTRTDVQTAILLTNGLGAFTAPIVGMLIDRYGPRRIALPSIVGLAVGFLFAASMTGPLWMFYTAYACIALLGAGTTPVTWTRAIASSFERQRGLALGLTLSGTGICALLIPHFVVFLLERYGWRGAYVGLALLPLLVAGPLVYAWFRPSDRALHAAAVSGDLAAAATPTAPVASGLTLREAASGYRFWVLLASILAIYLAVSGITPNLIPALTDQGMTAQRAAAAQSVFGFAVILGRVAVGWLVDRYWAPGVAAISLSLPAIGCLVLAGEPGFAIVAASIFIIGFAAGAELDLMAFFTARYFGLRHYAKIYAVMYAGLAVAGGAAPMLFASVYDVTRSYEFAFVAAAVLFAFGALILLALGRYPEKS